MTDDASSAPPTVSHLLGEMTWLMTQSLLHRALTIGDLEWLAMPALLTQQFYIFRDGDRPVGLALWASTDAVGEAKLDGGMLAPENQLTLAEWTAGDRLWLVDLIAPFANAENRQREVMIGDLISGPLRGRAFKFHQVDPATGERAVRTIDADAGDKLADLIKTTLAAQER